MLRSQKVLSASWLFPSMAIVVLKDFTKVSKLLGVRRIVSVNIKIPSSSSGKPAHFLIFTASQMIIYLCFVALSSISRGFFVFLLMLVSKRKELIFLQKSTG